MRAKRSGKSTIEPSQGKRAEIFLEKCVLLPQFKQVKVDYLFSFQKRTNYLFSAFSRTEYLFPKSFRSPPRPQNQMSSLSLYSEKLPHFNCLLRRTRGYRGHILVLTPESTRVYFFRFSHAEIGM